MPRKAPLIYAHHAQTWMKPSSGLCSRLGSTELIHQVQGTGAHQLYQKMMDLVGEGNFIPARQGDIRRCGSNFPPILKPPIRHLATSR